MPKKDWTGNSEAPYVMAGASNHSDEERVEHDYYATDPKAMEMLLEHETFNHDIWEPACGDGALCKILTKHGYNVLPSDIIDRGYPGTHISDFLKVNDVKMGVDIITNPPYKYVSEFILKALKNTDRKVAMFCKIQLLESKKRWEQVFSKHPPARIYVFVKRMNCYRNNDQSKKGSAICYAWFIWDKEYDDEPIIRWLNE